VKELLSGYVVRSSEKIPFYCRVCLHQGEIQEDLLKSFQGMIGYCGDDAGVYQGLGDAASMDSTIYTHGSINI